MHGGGNPPTADPPAVTSTSGSRSVAQQRRAQRCEVGRGDAPECRPSGRAARRDVIAPKVEIGSTLRGTVVTGTAVGATAKLTGSDTGACQTVTGTEYAGPEEHAELCDATPAPGAAKVGVGRTRRGQRITGTEVGRSEKVTGDEHGACTLVTGTEYLGADRVEQFCGSAPSPPATDGLPARTDRGHLVTGTEVGRSPKVTGDEPGACQKLTGTQYMSSAWPEPLCGTGVAPKVRVTTTTRGQTVTGTAVGHSPRVTGDHSGACASITGTEYVGLEQYQACNRAPVGGPAKVGVMRTWRGQQVSGTAVERSEKVTGDEFGACQPVTGDQYVGPEQYGGFCDPSDAAAAQARVAGERRSFIVPSGTRAEGGDRVTGSSRGARTTVTGTPYANSDSSALPAARGRLSGPSAQREVPATDPTGPPERAAADPTRSPEVPAVNGRRAGPLGPERSVARITGTAYGGGRRITGPIDRAEGLVSGTPEFRSREDGARSVSANGETPPDVHPRSLVTGEGRVHGFVVTGSAWRQNDAVTGTEGSFARRNPTLRGDPPAAPTGGREQLVERPEAPVSRVTGSSGSTEKGPLVTYSGGARG